jgi:mono/diheme cytochrome c family protein
MESRNIPIALITALLTVFFLLTSCESNPYQEGERTFKKFCSNCHMDSGDGLGRLMPPLAGSDFLIANRQRLPCILMTGLHDTIRVNGKVYAEEMPSMPSLSAIQITNVLNFVNNSFGNKNGVYRLDEVTNLLKDCKNR